MTDAPSQSQDKFIIRLPDGMRERLKTVAERNRRSMNQEAVAALKSHLEIEEHFAFYDSRLSPELAEGPPQDEKSGLLLPTGNPVSVTHPDLDRIVERAVIETLRHLGVKGE